MASTNSDGSRWRLEDIDLDRADTGCVKRDEALLLLLAASSFVETASPVYARNLIQHFAEDPEIAGWLARQWEPEEVQHGRVLRAYIARAWPDFGWVRAYAGFFRDYTSRCTQEELEPQRGLEMVARCVVETGTSALYRAIHDYANDPVLKSIAGYISSDEINHFKHFYRYFKKYHLRDGHTRVQVLSTLLRRTIELRREDADCGLRHAFMERYRRRALDQAFFCEMEAKVSAMVKRHYAFDMAAKMLLKPLLLPHRVEALIGRPIVLAGRWIAFG